MSAAVIAFGAISAFGRGQAAFFTGEVGARARVETKLDPELAGAKLARPFCARAIAEGEPAASDDADRATRILRAAMGDLFHALDERDAGWRSKRVGLALATSSGGMRSAEDVFRAIRDGNPVGGDLAERATYFAPMHRVLGTMRAPRFAPSTLVLTACSASTLAIGIALGWLESEACDIAIAGGFDAVSVFVASGFEALRATTSRLPSRPFGIERDGMALGEGAGLLALTRDDTRDVLGYVAGFGASGDATHVTAPDRTGAGLARAAMLALGSPKNAADVELVSAHGTATPFNDAAEWKAIVTALGPRARDVVVHPFKAQIGHTLGAAGAIESLAAFDAMKRGVRPAAVISTPRDPETPARLLERTEQGATRAALKLSAAFGGANASLLLRATPGEGSRARRKRAYASRAFHVARVPSLEDVSRLSGTALERLARADELVFLALAAVAELSRGHGSLTGAGIVVGHAYATVDVNDRYFQRVLERGDARAAEPRRFPYTSPNAVAGECSVAFGLTGPNLAVSSGLHGGVEALAIAADLVRAGDADRMVVVAVDAPRRAARAIGEANGWRIPPDGAVAVLVSCESVGAEIAETETATAGAPETLPRLAGHEALLPLVSGAREVGCASPWGAFARVTLAMPRVAP